METEPHRRTSFEHKRKSREDFTDTPHDDSCQEDGCMIKFFRCVFPCCFRSRHHSRRHKQLNETKPNTPNKTPSDAPPPAKNNKDEFTVVVEDGSPPKEEDAVVIVFQDDDDDDTNTDDDHPGEPELGSVGTSTSEDLTRESSDSSPMALQSPVKTPPQQPDPQEENQNSGTAGIVLESVPNNNNKKTV
jgi:hypothetical protein